MQMLLMVAVLMAADEKDDKAELKKFEGTWQLSSEVMDSKEQPADYVKRIRWIFDDMGHWKVEDDGKSIFTGDLKVFLNRNPKAADSTLTGEGDQKGKIVRAIYELEGDTLKQCWVIEGERPRAFDPKPGPGVNYSVYKRVKK
ncbi:MAG TPA: TIGR03067 domain-containing protein [Gemmataceae bacterium]|nr:TIGR03067 domain-containing protein [Gemmataceae bacterium]